MSTLRDVARVAGVSYQTVSRAINAPSSVRPHTMARVEDAIKSVGYFPNAAARRLKLGRSRLFGVVTTDFVGYGPSRSVQALVEAAEADGWNVLLVRVDLGDSWRSVGAGSSSTLNALFEYDVQIVGLVGGTEAVASAIRRNAPRLPILNIGAPIPGYPVAGVDQVGAMDALVEHLTGLGHRRIAHLAGPADSPDALAREHGWRTALAKRGLEPGPLLRADWTASGGFAALEAVADRRFTALLCGNDQMALGAMRSLRRAGLAIPHDVSVTGFDDIDEAAHFEPGLTTVHQPFDEVGRRALHIARNLVGDPEALAHELVEPPLRLRGSTAAVRA